MNEQFANIVDRESEVVDSIIDAMFHKKKDVARRFLMLVNDIVDYYVKDIESQTEVRFPIVYIPNSENWAKEILLKFLIYKLSLFYNNSLREKLNDNGPVIIRSKEEEKEYKRIGKPFQSYKKEKLSKMPQSYIGKTGHKNVIICRAEELMVSRENKNMFIEKFVGPNESICTNDNLTICSETTATDFERQLRDCPDHYPIDNLFLLYWNRDECNSFSKRQIDRLNKGYNAGIKNCFVFYLDDRPQRLYNLRRTKLNFCHLKYPGLLEKDALNYNHFCSFSQDELNYIFNKSDRNYCSYLKDINDQLYFKDNFGEAIAEVDHPISLRLELSMCLDQLELDDFVHRMKLSLPQIDYESYKISLDYQVNIFAPEVVSSIRKAISELKSVAVILPKVSSASCKRMFHRLFPETNFSFYDYSCLKRENGKNKIKEDNILNFVYRPHYANRSYYKYPNSFDSYELNKGQMLMDFIQGFGFDDIYLWDKYDYDKLKYNLLNSTYRKEVIGLDVLPLKPNIQRSEGENSFEDESNGSRTIESSRITLEDDSKVTILDTDYVLFYLNDNERIEIQRFSNIDKNLLVNSSIQKLDDIRFHLSEYVSLKQKSDNEKEKVIRNNYYSEGLITLEERDSDISIWKLLLNKKVDTLGVDVVFEAIMSKLTEKDRIQIGAFKNWYDLSSPMILPLSKIAQKRLFEYLDLLATPYLSIMRRKKIDRKNNTRQFNNMMDDYLIHYLLDDIDEEKYSQFINSDFPELLRVDTKDDLETLNVMLKEYIQLRKVKSIN